MDYNKDINTDTMDNGLDYNTDRVKMVLPAQILFFIPKIYVIKKKEIQFLLNILIIKY